MDQDNCCCFCFDARTGVMIIGTLLWIGLIGNAIVLSILIVAATQTDAAPLYSWYYIPQMIVMLILAAKFCKVVSSERTEHDFKQRMSFARLYLIMVFVQLGLGIGAWVGGQAQFSDYCKTSGNTPAQC